MTLYYKLAEISLIGIKIAKQSCFIPENSCILYNENEGDVKDGIARIYFSTNDTGGVNDAKVTETNDATIAALRVLLKSLNYVNMVYKTNILVSGTDHGVVEECTAYRMEEKLRIDRFVQDPQTYLGQIPADISDLAGKKNKFYYVISQTTNKGIIIRKRTELRTDIKTVAFIPIETENRQFISVKVGNKLYIFVYDIDDKIYHHFIYDSINNSVRQSHEKTVSMATVLNWNYKGVYIAPMIYIYAGSGSFPVHYYNTLTSTWGLLNGPGILRTIFKSGTDAFLVNSKGRLYFLIHNGVNNIVSMKSTEIYFGSIALPVVSNGRYIVYLYDIGDMLRLKSYDRVDNKFIEKELDEEESASIYSDETGYITGLANSINIRYGSKDYRINPSTLELIFIVSSYIYLYENEVVFSTA